MIEYVRYREKPMQCSRKIYKTHDIYFDKVCLVSVSLRLFGDNFRRSMLVLGAIHLGRPAKIRNFRPPSSACSGLTIEFL